MFGRGAYEVVAAGKKLSDHMISFLLSNQQPVAHGQRIGVFGHGFFQPENAFETAWNDFAGRHKDFIPATGRSYKQAFGFGHIQIGSA
jgi:hypothetical protein